LLALLAAACQSALGFEDFEHREMGDLSLYVAARLSPSLCRNRGGTENRACQDALQSLRRMTGGAPKPGVALTYGDLVQCVDLFMTPEKLIAASKPIRNYTNKNQYKSAKYESPFPESPEGSRLPQQCEYSFWASAQASHVNHTHFQDELLVSLVSYHTLALSAARQKNLYGALLVNAIADHYLHDFFAPGHIISPRANQTDLVSNAMHDKANDTGADFFLRQDAAGGVRDVLNRMAGLDTPEDKKNLWCRLLKYHKQEIAAACDDPMKTIAGSLEDLTRVAEKPKTVRLKGDKQLWRPDRDNGLRQRLLMVAANVRSILDVFAAYQSDGSGKDANHFDESAWAYFIEWMLFPGDEATAGLPFGYYAMGKKAAAPSDVTEPGERDAKQDFHYWYPVLGLSIGRESFFSGSRAGRNVFALDAPVYGWITKGGTNFGVAIGATHFEEGTVHGDGGQVRFGWILPKTETTVTAWARRLRHAGDAEHGWRNGLGVRFDQGFTSFLSLYVGTGRDYGAAVNGALENGYVFSAGILFGGPTSRILPF
jgi:hypothetical protein